MVQSRSRHDSGPHLVPEQVNSSSPTRRSAALQMSTGQRLTGSALVTRHVNTVNSASPTEGVTLKMESQLVNKRLFACVALQSTELVRSLSSAAHLLLPDTSTASFFTCAV